MEQSDQIGELAKALSEFQGAVTGAKKGGSNPHFRSSYARFEDAWNAAREHLAAHGLSVTQWPETGDRGVQVTTQIMHVSGQWQRGVLDMPVAKNDAQAFGSATTYACRYAFMAALGLPPVDDDGNAATAAPPKREDVAASDDPANFVVPFGKNKGKRMGDLSPQALGWYAEKCDANDVRANARALQEMRSAGEAAE